MYNIIVINCFLIIDYTNLHDTMHKDEYISRIECEVSQIYKMLLKNKNEKFILMMYNIHVVINSSIQS